MIKRTRFCRHRNATEPPIPLPTPAQSLLIRRCRRRKPPGEFVEESQTTNSANRQTNREQKAPKPEWINSPDILGKVPVPGDWYAAPDDYERHIGADVPEEMAETFTILAIYYGLPKTEVLRRLVEEWIEKCPSVDEALQEIAQRAYANWRLVWWENRHRPSWSLSKVMKRFDQWLSRTEHFLRRRALKRKTIDAIMQRIKAELLIDTAFSPFELPPFSSNYAPTNRPTGNVFTLPARPSVIGQKVAEKGAWSRWR